MDVQRKLAILADAAKYDGSCASSGTEKRDSTRRTTTIRLSDLARLHVPRNKALPFIVLSDHRPTPRRLDEARLIERIKPKATQLGFGF